MRCRRSASSSTTAGCCGYRPARPSARAASTRIFGIVAAARRRRSRTASASIGARPAGALSHARRSSQPPDLDACARRARLCSVRAHAGAGCARLARGRLRTPTIGVEIVDVGASASSPTRSRDLRGSTAEQRRRALVERARRIRRSHAGALSRVEAARRRLRPGRSSRTGSPALFDGDTAPTLRGQRPRDARSCAALLSMGVAARRAQRLPAGQRRQRAGARALPQFGFATAYTYHYRGAAGRAANDVHRRRRRLLRRSPRELGARRSRAAVHASRPRSRAPAAWSPARSPTSPAARRGSTAASSPIRTRPRSRCSA